MAQTFRSCHNIYFHIPLAFGTSENFFFFNFLSFKITDVDLKGLCYRKGRAAGGKLACGNLAWNSRSHIAVTFTGRPGGPFGSSQSCRSRYRSIYPSPTTHCFKNKDYTLSLDTYAPHLPTRSFL